MSLTHPPRTLFLILLLVCDREWCRRFIIVNYLVAVAPSGTNPGPIILGTVQMNTTRTVPAPDRLILWVMKRQRKWQNRETGRGGHEGQIIGYGFKEKKRDS